jgi:hypothetical protein
MAQAVLVAESRTLWTLRFDPQDLRLQHQKQVPNIARRIWNSRFNTLVLTATGGISFSKLAMKEAKANELFMRVNCKIEIICD